MTSSSAEVERSGQKISKMSTQTVHPRDALNSLHISPFYKHLNDNGDTFGAWYLSRLLDFIDTHMEFKLDKNE